MFKSLEAQCMKIVAGPSMKNGPVNCGLYILIHVKKLYCFSTVHFIQIDEKLKLQGYENKIQQNVYDLTMQWKFK